MRTYWNRERIAKHLGVSPAYVLHLQRDGRLPKPQVKVGMRNLGWEPAVIRKWAKTFQKERANAGSR